MNYSLKSMVSLAKSNPELWQMFIGCSIKHRDEKEYIIRRIDDMEYLNLESRKAGRKHDYLLNKISDYFTEITVPESNNVLIDRIDQFTKTQEKEEILNRLRDKYGQPPLADAEASTWADAIMERLEEGGRLEEDEQRKLFKIGMVKTLAVYHESRIPQDPWALPKASCYWRLAGDPQHALELTDITIEDNNELASKVLTSRGGAFRDINSYEEAVACALEALAYNDQECHPYNLLGALQIDLDNLDKSREYFEEAKQKNGYQPREQVEMIRGAIYNAKKNKDKAKEKLVTKYFKDFLTRKLEAAAEYDDLPC